MQAQRGGHPQWEIAHGEALAARGAETIWGWDSPAGQARVTRRVQWLLDACRIQPDSRVLECGCGTGVFTRRIAPHAGELVAADISKSLLAEAARACAGLPVSFRELDLEAPDELEDASFDAIYGVSVLHHLNLPRALPALARKLKPGGRMAFSEPNLLNPINRYVVFTPDPERRRRLGVSPGEMAFRPDELRSGFEAAGLRVTSLAHRDFMHPRVPRALIPLVEVGERLAERIPGVRAWSGSLWVIAQKPEA